MADIVMPRLSDTMEEGTILRWIGQEGEHIQRGQELVEIETDKATMVYESDLEGVLRILAEEGQSLAVGEVIARVGGEDAGARVQTPAGREEPAPGGPASGTADGAGRTPAPSPGTSAPQ